MIDTRGDDSDDNDALNRDRITDASSTTSTFSSESGTAGADGNGGSFVPEVLRYASSMRLTFKIRDGEPEKIFTPILEVRRPLKFASSC